VKLVLESQVAPDLVQLIGDDGVPAGVMAKLAAHVSPGYLHRGFSVFLFDESGRVLLQRRAGSKYHFAGKWSNTCCSHPVVSVSDEATARRRLLFELGVDTPMEPVGSFRYTAIDAATGLVEREDDTVLVGYVRSDLIVVPNPAEVSSTRFIPVPDLQEELRRSPGDSTPWLAPALDCAIKAGHPVVKRNAAHIGPRPGWSRAWRVDRAEPQP
jgi:isopentenyl-diphosphate Delta-isomerase